MQIEIKEIPASQTWDLRHRIMWPDKPLDYVKLEEDENGVHFGLWKNDVLVTVVSLFIVNGKAQFRKLATETKEQGNGYASKILEHILAHAAKENAHTIWCNARADKTAFYKKFGLEETDKTYVKGGIDFVIMEGVI